MTCDFCRKAGQGTTGGMPACYGCEVFKMLNKPKTEIDIKADQYYDFMRQEGLWKKLSLCDMRKIFNHFKENWRSR